MLSPNFHPMVNVAVKAGGPIGNFTGESDLLEQKECVAGDPKVYDRWVAILQAWL